MTEGTNTERDLALVKLTTRVISSYLGNHVVQRGELSGLISDVHASLARASSAGMTNQEEGVKYEPAVPVRSALKRDSITCLCCGKPFKSLRRHLKAEHNLTPEQYREEFGLASNYPMVAPAYAEERSALAKKMGLGRRPRRSAA